MTLYEEILDIKKRRKNQCDKQGLQGLQRLHPDLKLCNDCNNPVTQNVTSRLREGYNDHTDQAKIVTDPGDQVEPVTGLPTIPDESAPEEDKPKIVELEARIIDTLQGRPLPIRLSPCEKILEVAGYAKAEARNVYHQSRYVRSAARVRLQILGVERK